MKQCHVQTVIYGEVLAVDCMSAEMQLIGGGTRVTVSISRELAFELERFLSHVVGLEGVATWEGGVLKEFKATGMNGFRERDENGNTVAALEALKQLACAAKGRWDNVDPDAFVRDLRDDHEPSEIFG